MDVLFGHDRAGRIAWYAPYQTYMPTKQAQLIELWDKLAIPHDQEKQLCSVVLPIIGFNVDLTSMRVTMPSELPTDLIASIRAFVSSPPSGNRRHSLCELQCLAGWINWVLNTYPLLRPGLSAKYKKMSGKTCTQAPISIISTVIHKLEWIVDHLEHSNGVSLVLSMTWGPSEASLTLFTDASLQGLGF